MKAPIYAVVAIATFFCGNALAESALTVKATGIKVDGFLDEDYAFCAPKLPDEAPTEFRFQKLASNKSPELSWSGAPKGTLSYAVVGYSPDGLVNTQFAGMRGKVIKEDEPRKISYHWVLVNIPTTITKLNEGIDSFDFKKTGPNERQRSYGLRGVNSLSNNIPFIKDFKGFADGYAGPCPAPNDLLVRNVFLKVFALDVASLPVKGDFSGEDAVQAMQGHILADGEVKALYTLNPLYLSYKK
jgi:Raf kinase inhibitor-like YbhB/YbcL family protein